MAASAPAPGVRNIVVPIDDSEVPPRRLCALSGRDSGFRVQGQLNGALGMSHTIVGWGCDPHNKVVVSIALRV